MNTKRGQGDKLGMLFAQFALKGKDVAEALALDPGLVSKWLNGRRMLRIDSGNVERLIDFLLSRELTQARISWLRETLREDGISSEFGSAADLKLGLTLWLADENDPSIRFLAARIANDEQSDVSSEKFRFPANEGVRVTRREYACRVGAEEVSKRFRCPVCAGMVPEAAFPATRKRQKSRTQAIRKPVCRFAATHRQRQCAKPSENLLDVRTTQLLNCERELFLLGEYGAHRAEEYDFPARDDFAYERSALLTAEDICERLPQNAAYLELSRLLCEDAQERQRALAAYPACMTGWARPLVEYQYSLPGGELYEDRMPPTDTLAANADMALFPFWKNKHFQKTSHKPAHPTPTHSQWHCCTCCTQANAFPII